MAATLAGLAALLFGTAGASGAELAAAGSVAGSGTLASAAPILSSAKSRKVHGAAGAFDLLLAPTPEDPTTEPRSGGAGGAHTIVFTFDKAVSGGTAIVADGGGSAGAPTFSGSEMRVPLTGVPDAQYATVSVANVASTDGGTGGSGSVRIGFLAGDVNGSRSVTLADLLAVNVALTQPVTAANYLHDVNVSGTLSLSDNLLVSARLSQVLPAPAIPDSCAQYTAVNLGDLQFNGVQLDSFSMRGTFVAYARIVIPNPLPANWGGRTAQISVFENGDGSYWKKIYLSRTACDFTARTSAWAQGTGANLYVNFGGTSIGAVTVQPGEVWYLNVKNETNLGTPSCGPGLNCNFGIRAYPPAI